MSSEASLQSESAISASPRLRRLGLVLVGLVVLFAALIASMLLPDDLALLAFAVPIGLIAIPIILLQPEIAFIILVAYLPFNTGNFRLSFLPAGLTGAKLLGFGLLAVFLFAVLFRRRRFRFLDDWQDYLLVSLLAVMLFALIFSDAPHSALDEIQRIARLIAFYYVSKNLITSPRIMARMMWVIIVTSAVASGWGLREFYEARNIRIHDIRARGFYGDPNVYAAMMTISLAIGLYLFTIATKRYQRLVLSGCLAVILWGIVLSGSRGALISMLIMLFIYIWRHPWRNRLFIIAVAVGLLSFPFWPNSIRARFGLAQGDASTSEVAEDSLERRLGYADFAFDLMVERPLVGYGYGSFSNLYAQSEFASYANPMTEFDRFRIAHNAYLEILVGTGLIGLLVFVALLLISLRDLHQAARKLPYRSVEWATANGFEFAMISIIINSFFLNLETLEYFWLTIAVASALRFYTRRRYASQPQQQTLAA